MFKAFGRGSKLLWRGLASSSIVVTGLGVVCPLGVGAKHAWSKLCDGETTGVLISDSRFEKVSSKVACYVPRGGEEGQFDMEKLFTKGDQQRMSLSMMFGLVAADEALKDAGWSPQTEKQKVRSGVSVGMGMVDLDYIGESYMNLVTGKRKISPYFVPRILPNLAPGHIAIAHGLMGPNHSCSTACATGGHSIGEAMRLLQHGVCDVMVAGGVDACINPLAMMGFSRARALSSKYNDNPAKASRPFDVNRDGFVMGEGAGILVLEREEHAVERGAKVYCKVVGYGSSGDADHITTAREDGAGAINAMQAALKDAQVESADVWSVNAHATSTPLGDKAECRAIRSVLGGSSAYVTSNKGGIGHLLGAAGAVESVFSALSVMEGVVPPCVNIDSVDSEFVEGLNIVIGKKIVDTGSDRRILIKNSFGFGGTNVSLIFENYSK
eukprot:GFUD01040741.1.p1 GENE.GFUD01040741.1~~GFUD01040741.1.p1  ORF type:complete len:440 (+),score=86.03 GFUD01040741.1:39-1358(+)